MEPTGVERPSTIPDRLNATFDQLPRERVHLGAREVPAFRSIGILGFHLALLTAMLTGFRAGVSLSDAVGVSVTAAASFFLLGLVRRALTGRESLELLAHVWVAMGSVALYLWAAGVPILPGLDVLSVSLCVFLAFGHLGCLTAGCCHGYPAPLGPAYPSSAGLPDRLRGVRLFPVSLVESMTLLAIGTAGYVLAGSRPGTATVWVLAAYATVRFGTEALRGDRRPTVAGIPVARTMAVLQLLAALVAGELWLAPGEFEHRHLVAAVPLVAALVGGLWLDRSRRDPLTAPNHLDEIWATSEASSRTDASRYQPVMATTTQDLRVAASWSETGLHVSLSHPSRRVDHLPHAFGIAPLAHTATATHFVIPFARVGYPPTPAEPPFRTDSRQPSALSAGAGAGLADDGYFGPDAADNRSEAWS
jgi:hypothetical protein